MQQRLNYFLLKKKNNFVTLNLKKQPNFFYKFLKLIKIKVNKIQGQRILAIVGKLIDIETIGLVKKILTYYGCTHYQAEESMPQTDFRSTYLSKQIFTKFQKTNLIFLVGVNPKKELPLFNMILRNYYMWDDTIIAYIGTPLKLPYKCIHLSSELLTIINLIEGKHKICKLFKKAKNPLMLCGSSFKKLELNQLSLIQTLIKLLPTLKNITHITNFTGTINSYELGLVPGQYSFLYKKITFFKSNKFTLKPFLLILFGTMQIPKKYLLHKTFVVYIGHSGLAKLYSSNLIIPSLTFMEQKKYFINFEGFLQQTSVIIQNKIFRFFPEKLPTVTIKEINYLQTIYILTSRHDLYTRAHQNKSFTRRLFRFLKFLKNQIFFSKSCIILSTKNVFFNNYTFF